MATGTILFMPGAALLPDGTTSNLAPALQRLKSTGTAPGVYAYQLAFDATNDEWATWAFRLPTDYASAPVVKIQFKMTSATTGNVVWDARLGTITGGSSVSANAKVFAAANTVTTAAPGTVGFVAQSSITMTNADSMVAGDWSVIRLLRNGSSGSDTASGDAEFLAMALEYTTT